MELRRDWNRKSTTSLFLSLPAEIRNRIYEFSLTMDHGGGVSYNMDERGIGHVCYPHGLVSLTTDKRVRRAWYMLAGLLLPEEEKEFLEERLAGMVKCKSILFLLHPIRVYAWF